MTDTATEIDHKELKLPHCGELSVNKDMISGWFHPLKLSLWSRIVTFHRTISLAHRAESVSYHRWNQKTKCYDTIIPFQISAKKGLSVDTNWEDERNKKLLDDYGQKWGRDFFPACTIHTHVDISAFESGTDAGDEKDWPGWHITLGHLISHPTYDIHCRIRLPRIPSLKEFTSINMAYEIEAKHLFPKDTPAKEIVKPSNENTAWSKYLDRVSLR